jgi:predicted ABC-type ATPase
MTAPQPTYAVHTNDEGLFGLERSLLHAEIVAAVVEGHRSHEQPEALFMAGGPGSGKSQLTTRLGGPVDAAVIDIDEIRSKLPEYGQWLTESRDDAAVLTHREAEQITLLATAAALLSGLNVVYDGVGGNDRGQFVTKIEPFLQRGYDVTVRYATVSVDVALERERARFARSGRRVPEDVLREKHAEASRGLEAVAGLAVARIELYDTTGASPRLICAGPGGAGLDGLTVHDQSGYAEFLEKGEA